MPVPDPSAVNANAYSIAFRLLGDRAAAHAAVGIAVERLRRSGALDRPDWLALLAEATVAHAVGVAAAGSAATDPDASLRAALRRRLAAASDPERVASSLHHLAGYPIESVATFMQRSPDDVDRLAGAIAPPPGVSYRELGDPELVGTVDRTTPQRRTVSASTIVSVLVVIGLVFGASRCVGPRPTLGPEPEVVPVSVGPAEPSVSSAGCSQPVQLPGVLATTADAASGPVPYRIAVPPSTSAPSDGTPSPHPLLLAVADAGTDADAFSRSSGIEERGLAEGLTVVTVSPPGPGTTNALDATGAVLDAALDVTCVDLARVTVTGFGTGGQVATAMGCTHADRVSVVAAVGGASWPPDCTISPAVSLLLQWAADDRVFPPSGGAGPAAQPPSTVAAPLPTSAAGQVLENWARGIDAGAPTRSTLPDGTATEQATAPSGAAVRSVIAPTGGHTWTDATTEAIVAFAADHARSS